MTAGIAGALLVFTGIWHATEWIMDGRRRDTWRLVPVGICYLILGVLVVGGTGGVIVQICAALAAAAGGITAFRQRETLDIRKWVIWAFIIIDVIVVLALMLSFL